MDLVPAITVFAKFGADNSATLVVLKALITALDKRDPTLAVDLTELIEKVRSVSKAAQQKEMTDWEKGFYEEFDKKVDVLMSGVITEHS